MLAMLLACTNAVSSVSGLRPYPEVAVLTVAARHEGEKPLGLSAQLWRGSSGERESAPRPGECERVRPAEAGTPFASQVQVRLGSSLSLPWIESVGRYAAVGPLRGMDPAWNVGDLRWVAEGQSHEFSGLLRFGAEPQITGVSRRLDGGVTLSWNAADAGQLELQSMGLRCGATREGAELPWWAVPAQGGEVVLRSTRVQSQMEGDTLVVARAVIETVIPLDRPVEESAGKEPVTPEPAPKLRPTPRKRVSVG